MRVNLDAAAVAQIVDESAPLGPKKQMFFLQINERLTWTMLTCAQNVLIQKRDLTVLLDDLGEHLRTVKGRPIGPIDAIDDRRTVLNESVGFFYELLRQEVTASIRTRNSRNTRPATSVLDSSRRHIVR